MDKPQVRITKEIMDNRELYLSMAGEKKSNLFSLYNELTPLFNTYYQDLLNETITRAGYAKVLKEHKVDPYLTGGAAQGIAGIGAGITMALSADTRNKQIDTLRASYKEAVFNNSVTTSVSEKKVLRLVKQIDELLDSVEAIKQYRDQRIEEEYQQAVDYMRNGSELAYDIFLSLGNYKDSKLMVEESKRANNNSLIKQVIVLSIICSAFIGLFGLTDGATGYFAVFCCAFVVNCIMFGSIAYKNRIKE